MTKREAVIKYLEGEKIRFYDWYKYCYVYYDFEDIVGKDETGNNSTLLNLKNLNEIGWEVYTEIEMTPYECLCFLNDVYDEYVWELSKKEDIWFFSSHILFVDQITDYTIEDINIQYNQNIRLVKPK
jgi:hypothetical protein